MQLWRKLLLYFLGLGLGMVMVYFFFGDRDIQCSYFPNDRVLSDLRKKEISLSADLQEGTGQTSLDTSGLYLALEFGKINFGASEINDQDCNVYQIELKSKQIMFFIENCDSTASLVNVAEL
jgi:hypothetical protein